MATYSRTNGWIGAVAAVTCFVVAVLDGWDGNVALAGLFGFLSLSLALQAGDDLVWQGNQPVVAPLRKVAAALTLGFAVWAVADLLF